METASSAARQSGLVFDIRRYSIHDGPGIRTVVFFMGCPLDCAWCHNPEGKSPVSHIWLRQQRCIQCGACAWICKDGAIASRDGQISLDQHACTLCGDCLDVCFPEALEIVGKEMTVDQVMDVVMADTLFYEQSGGGVTFSGGEPLQQPQFLVALLQACKERGIYTTLDTSAFARWEVISPLRDLVDIFLIDLKLMDDERHKQYTGVSNRVILENIRRLVDEINAGGRSLQSTKEYPVLIRIPIIPTVNDDEQNLQESARFIASLPGVTRVDLLPYHGSAAGKYNNLGMISPMANLATPGEDRMEEIASLFRAHHFDVGIGG